MRRTRTKKNELLDVVKRMPPLHHKLPGEDFAWEKSEAVRWLVSRPEIMNFVWQSIRNRADADKIMIYNPETGKWRGSDFHGDAVFHGDGSADSDASGEAGQGEERQAGLL